MADDSSKSQEETIKNYIQQWKELGVRVKLLNGRFQEFNTMVEKLSSGSTDYDLWFELGALRQNRPISLIHIRSLQLITMGIL